MNWAAWTLISISMLGAVCGMLMHGKPRTGEYNGFSYLLGAIATLTLWYFAGFFS